MLLIVKFAFEYSILIPNIKLLTPENFELWKFFLNNSDFSNNSKIHKLFKISRMILVIQFEFESHT